MRFIFQCFRLTSYVIAALQLHLAHATPGQPGTLDASWGANGKVITAMRASGNDQATSMAVQADGKALLGGICVDGNSKEFCIARYQTNGALDLDWNATGKVITAISSGVSTEQAIAIAVQPDGKVLLAGNCFNGVGGTGVDFCALRFTANGSIDPTWNGTGKVISPISSGSGSDYATAMAVQPDGKVVLAGFCGTPPAYDFCAARYNTNGTLDSSFNNTGKVITPLNSGGNVGEERALAIAVQPDGKVLLAGVCISPGFDFCALRYHADGALDLSWNGTGMVITPVSATYDLAAAIALQPDGKVLLAGACGPATNFDFCAVRYHANGSLDLSWNGTGKVVTPIGSGSDQAYAIKLQPDGKVLIAGFCFNGANNTADDFCAVRYHTSGTLDLSWNGNGKVMTAISSGTGGDRATGMALLPDGKVLLAGFCSNGSNDDFCAVRYDGGPFAFNACSPDIDGDGLFLATTDALIYTRVALGITGNVLIDGISFPPTATRNTWPLIRDHLVTQCGMSLVQ